MIGVKLAYYRKKDWKRFVKIVDDRESLHDTWNDWHKDFLRAKNELLAQGFVVDEVEIDLDELIDYCKMRGIRIDGKARSEFVQIEK